VKPNRSRSVNQLKVALGLTKFAVKANIRNKASYFFSLIFPLIFITIFGFLGSSGQSIKLAIPDNLNHDNRIYQTIKTVANQEDAPVKLIEASQSDLEKQLQQAKVDAILTTPQDSPNSIELVTSNANPQGKAGSATFLNGVISQMNLQATGVKNPPFSLSLKETSGKEYRYIDFLLPGQIGFSLIAIATFGIAFPLITLRKTLVLKRMFATTVTPITFVISQCLSRSIQAMIQAGVILLVGILAFHFTLVNGWVGALEMLFLSFIGVLVFSGFGFLIGNIAKDEQSLPIALNLFNFPQMLLAGVFFPIDGMPKWVQYIGNNLPLAYLNTAMRKVEIEGAHLPQLWPYLLGLLGWGIISYLLAARVFKAE
jgi:ABC-2 type transport system permease protein